MPGAYSVSLGKVEDGQYTELLPAQPFNIRPLRLNTLAAVDQQAFDSFCKEVAELRRNAVITQEYANELSNKLKYIRAALNETPAADASIIAQAEKLQQELHAVNRSLNGDASLARREFETPSSINDRIGNIEGGMWSTTSAPTGTYRKSYQIAEKQLNEVIIRLQTLATDVQSMESRLDGLKAPWTPGRKPGLK